MIATVTSKGQMTLPVEARRQLGLKAGSLVDITIHPGRVLKLVPLDGTIRQLKGALKKPARPLSLDEMERAIADGVKS
jgi:AbrB family looped-hinge helix DNA binding protein